MKKKAREMFVNIMKEEMQRKFSSHSFIKKTVIEAREKGFYRRNYTNDELVKKFKEYFDCKKKKTKYIIPDEDVLSMLKLAIPEFDWDASLLKILKDDVILKDEDDPSGIVLLLSTLQVEDEEIALYLMNCLIYMRHINPIIEKLENKKYLLKIQNDFEMLQGDYEGEIKYIMKESDVTYEVAETILKGLNEKNKVKIVNLKRTLG